MYNLVYDLNRHDAHRAGDVLATLLPIQAVGAAKLLALLLPRPNALLGGFAVLLARGSLAAVGVEIASGLQRRGAQNSVLRALARLHRTRRVGDTDAGHALAAETRRAGRTAPAALLHGLSLKRFALLLPGPNALAQGGAIFLAQRSPAAVLIEIATAGLDVLLLEKHHTRRALTLVGATARLHVLLVLQIALDELASVRRPAVEVM